MSPKQMLTNAAALEALAVQATMVAFILRERADHILAARAAHRSGRGATTPGDVPAVRDDR